MKPSHIELVAALFNTYTATCRAWGHDAADALRAALTGQPILTPT